MIRDTSSLLCSTYPFIHPLAQHRERERPYRKREHMREECFTVHRKLASSSALLSLSLAFLWRILYNNVHIISAFSPAKNGFKSVIFIFCCSSVSVGNISLHFQNIHFAINCNNPVRFALLCLHKESDNSQCSTQRSDLIIISLSGMTWRNRTNWDRLNPEELWKCLQDASRNLPAKLQYC